MKYLNKLLGRNYFASDGNLTQIDLSEKKKKKRKGFWSHTTERSRKVLLLSMARVSGMAGSRCCTDNVGNNFLSVSQCCFFSGSVFVRQVLAMQL